MKKTLTLGTLLLGCCLAAAAQTGGTQNQNLPGTPASAYPQDQTGQTQSNPAMANPSAMPPDSNAPGPAQPQAAAPATQTATAQPMTAQGCLSKSVDGSFMLADNSGQSFQLSGDTTLLTSYIGMEVRVDGTAVPNGAENPGSMSSSAAPDSSGTVPGTFPQISVNKVQKVADNCGSGSTANP